MTARKPKPTPTPLIDLLTEKLQLVTVTVEHKVPVRAAYTWQGETQMPAERSLPKRGKVVLH
jgi:hypothetical protein